MKKIETFFYQKLDLILLALGAGISIFYLVNFHTTTNIQNFMKGIVELLSKWSFCILLIFILFKKEISLLLEELKNLTKTASNTLPELLGKQKNPQLDTTLDKFINQNISQEKKGGTSSKKQLPPITIEEYKPVMEERMKVINLHLNTLKQDGYDKKEVLVQALAEIGLKLNVELICNIIFNSQLKALEIIVASGEVERKKILNIYEEAKSIKENQKFYSNYSFYEWLNFLKKEDVYLIKTTKTTVLPTEKGIAFLKYIKENKKNLRRPF